MVRAKSTRPAPVKKRQSRNLSAGPHSGRRKRNRKERCRHGFGMSLRGLLLFYSLPLSFISLSVLTLTVGSLAMVFKAYGVCMPSGFHVHGIDVSHYQGNIDWKMLTQTRQGKFPIHFVFMKASEGGDYGDKAFSSNFDSAKTHGFIRGAYHFYNPKTDPVRQADFFINSVKLDSGDLPPVLDIEKRGKDENQLRRDLKLWLDKIEQHYKVKPILYTSYKFKTRYLNDSVFNSYPYWIAHYYVDSVEYRGEWKFWQHTDVGTLPGIREKVDLNIFNGSLEELQLMTIKK